MYDLTIPKRIARRREDKRLAGYQLAKMAGISPSYLSLIESGRKIPSEAVAMRLAAALGDDPDLYRAWVETAGDHDIASRVNRLERMRKVRSQSNPLPARRSARSGMREWQRARTQSRPAVAAASPDSHAVDRSTVQVALLPEGTDPSDATTDGDVRETIAIDAALLENDQDPCALFAYRVGPRSIERVADVAATGDVLVFSADPTGVDPAAVYAVRHRGRIVLSRIVYTKPTLLLMGCSTDQSPLPLAAPDDRALHRVLAGVAVAGIRTWPKPQPANAGAVEPVLGRGGRLDAGHIVRDCEWKENYGWRPVQRAEDMDYLIANPTKTIRFRLIRDGRVRHVLEMNAAQWQQALGDYYGGPTWYAHGYIVAITRRRKGEYTAEFQDRWASYVRDPNPSER